MRYFRKIPLPLALIILVGVLQSIAWDLALPAFQGPDEDTHFAYIQYLAETGHLPSSTSGGTPLSSEVQSTLTVLNLRDTAGNLGARPAWDRADVTYWRATQHALPKGSRTDGQGPNLIAKNPPLYYTVMSIPYRLVVWLPLLPRLFVLRLFNALCYLIGIIMAWLIAGEVFGRVRWKQALAAGVVALEPQLAFMSAVINADNLLIALTSAFLLAALRLVRRGPTMARVLTCSALSAAAVLTHGRGLVTLPVLCVALLVAWLAHRPQLRDTLTRGAAALVTVGGALVLYLLLGKVGGGGGSLYGGQIDALNSGSFKFRQYLSSIYQFYFPRLPSMQPRIGPAYGYRQVFINTFFATFGSLEITFRQRIYDILQVLSAVGLGGLYTACFVRGRQLLRGWPTVVVMLALLFTTLFFLHYVSYRSLLGNGGSDPLIVGRYLLPVVPLFGLAVAFTVGTLPRKIGVFVGAAILSLGLLLSLGAIAITAARFYA